VVPHNFEIVGAVDEDYGTDRVRLSWCILCNKILLFLHPPEAIFDTNQNVQKLNMINTSKKIK